MTKNAKNKNGAESSTSAENINGAESSTLNDVESSTSGNSNDVESSISNGTESSTSGKSTLCPACSVDTEDCVCGLTHLVSLRQEEINNGEIEIISIASETDPERIGYNLYAHAVIMTKQFVVEQYLGNQLVGTVGPYIGEQGEEIFKEIMKALCAKGHCIVKAPSPKEGE